MKNKAVLISSVLFSLCAAQADDQLNAFKEGYVTELMNPNAHRYAEPALEQTAPAVGANKPMEKKKVTETPKPDWIDGSTVQPQKIKRTSEEKAGVKVRSIGAIFRAVNAKDTEHDLSVLTTMVDQLNVPLAHIYFLLRGFDLSLFNQETFERLAPRGAEIEIALSLPAEYENVKTAPAWIIATEKGDVLLEGALNPLDFFNSHGEFVEPAPVPLTQQSSLAAQPPPIAEPLQP